MGRRIKLMPSDIFAHQLKEEKITGFIREYKFHPERKWKIDFVHLGIMLAVECEGGVWSGGRHVRGQGFINDCYKYSEIVLAGFRLFRFTTCMIENGDAIKFTKRAIK